MNPEFTNLVTPIAPKIALRLSRCVSALTDPFWGPYYSQEGEDIILQRLFEDRHTGFYVDVGAHHPNRFSNTRLLYKRNWRGINIEPNPDAIALFRRKRPRDLNLAVGVSNSTGVLTYVMFDDPALNTFSAPRVAELEAHSPYKVVREIQIPVRPLSSLLAEYLPQNTPVDLLSVDVEGLDLNVLASNDWVSYRPFCVLVEAMGIRFSGLSEHPLHKFMVAKGYDLVAKTMNSLFYINSI